MIEHFPSGFIPTSKQVSNFDKIRNNFYSNKKFLIIQAPTGTGKSFIAKTIANISRSPSAKYVNLVDSGDIYKTDIQGNYLYSEQVFKEESHGCFALTITKTLQDQYQNLFEDTKVLKGKGNYDCAIDDQFEVDTAPCVYLKDQKKKCLSNKCCHYYNAIDNALKSKFASLSYSKFLSFADHFKRRQYLVLDEASELESALVKEFTFVLPYLELKKKGINFVYSSNRIKIYENLNSCYQDLKEYLIEIKKHLAKKSNSINNNNRLIADYKKYNRISQGLHTLIRTFEDSKYSIEKDKFDIVFTPFKVDILSKYIFENADKVILLSATFVGIKNFVKTLGISDDNYDFIDIDSTFNPKHSPIVVCKGTPLNKNNLPKLLPTVVSRIEWILDKHSNEKGIIHTHSNPITQSIQSYIKDKYKNRLLIREPGGNKNEELLKKHISSKEPTVLMSPSMGYGVDLKGDLGRFQVIVKLPFMPLYDTRVQMMYKEDKKWYNIQMLNHLIQLCGRTTRGEDDYSVTYIMDSGFLDYKQENIRADFRNELPEYFIKRCV